MGLRHDQMRESLVGGVEQWFHIEHLSTRVARGFLFADPLAFPALLIPVRKAAASRPRTLACNRHR